MVNKEKRIVFLYDSEVCVWIGQVEGVELLKGIILEDSDLSVLTQRRSLAIEEMLEIYGNGMTIKEAFL